VKEKQQIRVRMRQVRRDHAASLPTSTLALIMMRPPAPIVEMIPEGATVGIYNATEEEAPTGGYARWLHESGRPVALPWFADRKAPMQFRIWANPFAEELVEGPFGPQPDSANSLVIPSALFMPLVAFTANCERLGQGGGYYDRWLAANPDTITIGMAWDQQLVDHLPIEPHDQNLQAVVTPTRIFRSPS